MKRRRRTHRSMHALERPPTKHAITRLQVLGALALASLLAHGGCADPDGSATGGSTASSMGGPDGEASTTRTTESTEASGASTTGNGTDDSAETGTGTGSGGADTGGHDETAGSSDAGSDGETGLAECGDGVVQDPEQCDDANAIDGDGCESDCIFSPQALVWERQFDLGHSDTALDLALGPTGGLHVVGVSSESQYYFETVLWSLRTTDGDLLWSESFTGDAVRAAHAVDARDNLIAIAGVVGTDGSFHESIRAYDPSGDLQWSRSSTPLPEPSGTHLGLGPTGSAVTANRAVAAPSSQVRLTTEQDGLVWSTSTSAVAMDVVVDETGNVFVSGVAVDEGFLAKLDPTGQTLWTQTWSGSGPVTRLTDLAIAPDGTIQSVGQVLQNGNVDVDVAVHRWSSDDGTLLSAVQHDVEGSVLAYGVDVGTSGKVIVCGSHNPNGPGTIPLNAWVAEVDEDGALLWEHDVTPGVCLGVVVDGEDFSYLAGSVSSDAWIARLAP